MDTGGAAGAVAEGSTVSLPKGGGAIAGIGETFAANMQTGSGGFTVPITLPAGRGGATPRLALAYGTGSGNGPFGLGWALSLPGVMRKTSRGVPRYEDGDTYLLSGVEDLVPVSGTYPGRVRYRPRTEGGFARIEHVRDATGDRWEVRTKDGMLTRYGTERPADAGAEWRDPAVIRRPGASGSVFAWSITETVDPLGNRIRYTYLRDQGSGDGHEWDQPLIQRVEYADYGDPAASEFLVALEFEYEPRPDPFSEYRAGFEIRTTLRCRSIRVSTRAADSVVRVSREYRLAYEQATFNGVSLLDRIDVVGVQDSGGGNDRIEERLPPLTFSYSSFDPAARRFTTVDGESLPPMLTGPDLALVDLRGCGLPDIVDLGAGLRFWANRGGGRFDPPRAMPEAPPHRLSDPAVRFLDANGDGRTDLLVADGDLAGYFPLDFAGQWDRGSFRSYRQLPSADLTDPAVRLVDLDGDGLTDVLRSGSRLECWFNDRDPRLAWKRTARADGPAVDLADPRVRLADMTGDGLQDIVLVHNGNVSYWPNLGHGRWGEPVRMRRSPRLPAGHDPRRVLLGDIDGDGCADLVYIDHGRVQVWGSQSGAGWTEQPVTINGTPALADTDDVQLVDLYGTGTAGLLWNRVGNRSAQVRFLDFCGGVKPYLLSTMDNNRGAKTTVRYRSSTHDFLRDQAAAETRWRTTLPFPVHVVASVEVDDQISLGRLVTEYRYHHGYWDGEEREFRGFAMVEQLDSETFPPSALDAGVHHSPPTLTKSWFHVGPVAALEGRARLPRLVVAAAVEADDWVELDLSHEYWPGDPPMLTRPVAVTSFLNALSRSDRRDALRALSGQPVRSELYALDGGDRQDLPYTVTETLSGLREESPPAPEQDGRRRIFFPFTIGSRTTQWERGNEPMTKLSFSAGFDAYGFATQQLAVAVPRDTAQPYLSTYSTTEYARRDDASVYLVDRVCRTTEFEVRNDGRQSVFELRDAVFGGTADLRVIGHGRTFFDGPEFVGLPVGQLGAYGLPTRSESLAFTSGFLAELGGAPPYLSPGTVTWTGEYPQEFRELTPALAGYVHYDDADLPGSPGGYYLVGSRHRYDVHDPDRVPRGLVLASRDASGAESRVEYDDHDLLPVRTTDPIGLTVEAAYDYRVLVAREVTDINGNTSDVTFSPAGFVTASFVRGKNGEGVGDVTEPSVRLEYDLDAFVRERQPLSVRSIRRVHHDSATDIPAAERDEVIVSVDYSDGLGRLVQTRSQAEDVRFGDPFFGGDVVPADQAAPVGPAAGRTREGGEPDNVVVSGWQVYDNKGRVVERYEPFFDSGFDYVPPTGAQLGQKAVMFYDPRGQLARTVAPDGSEQRIVLGVPVELGDPDVFSPTPWESYTYDANDNAGRTHGPAAASDNTHWNTPASVEVDALGRVVETVARNGPDPAKDWLTTRSAYDIQGNLLRITDPLGRTAFQYRYDLAGRRWRSDSIDAGRRDTVPDGLGRVIEVRDAKGAVTLHGFDLVHRPIRMWARDGAAEPTTLRQRIEYGDDGDPGQPAGDRAAARAQNLLGQAVRHYDEAGLRAVTSVDFKGNVLEAAQQVVADAPILATYAQAAGNGWHVPAFHVDWNPGPGQSRAQREAELLDQVLYATSTRFDALNRVTRQVLPVDTDGERSVLQPSYNRAGGLERVLLDGTVHVERIAYDAKGQRTLIAYGNGVMTRYAYDKRTFRLTRLRTEGYVRTGLTYQPTGQPLQDHGFDYDLAGNLLRIRDRMPGAGLPGRPDQLDRTFTYDPTYRLKSATGRETDVPRPAPWDTGPRGTDITRARAYTENYTYNAAGTLLRLHHASTGGFTRDFVVTTPSNRVHAMQEGTTPYGYTYDANGNLRTETSARHFTWNHLDQLVTFGTQTAGAEPSVHAHYLYDASGQRVKKLVRRQGGAVEVTHYLGAFEHHRWGGGVAEQNNHIHLMDDQQRIGLVRIGPAAPGDQSPAVTFQLADQVGSSVVTIDDTGAVVNREEYTPYGETSFGSYARKRYRFTGKERDEESGLNYHSARYYLPWLARWASCDPLGTVDGPNLYRYARNNPIRLTDRSGTNPDTDRTVPPTLNGVGVTFSGDGVRFGSLSKPEECDELNPMCGTIRPSSPAPAGDVTDPDSWPANLVHAAKATSPPPARGGDIVWRKSNPHVDPNPWREGFRPGGTGVTMSPGEHALNMHGTTEAASKPTPYKSASYKPGGADSMRGEPFRIDLREARASGVKVHSTDDILRDMERLAREGHPQVTPGRIEMWAGAQQTTEGVPVRPGQPLRGEILLEGNVPADAIVTPTRQALKYAGRTVMILGIAITVWDLGKAAAQSVEQGSIRPIAREAVRQTTTWGAAVAMGVDGAMIGAAFGPVGAIVGGVIGSAVGAIAGSIVGDWLADLF